MAGGGPGGWRGTGRDRGHGGARPAARGHDPPTKPLVSAPDMARRSLRPELNRIRAWVRQGRTDAWIAHQLEVTVQQIQAFKRDQQLEGGDETDGTTPAAEYDDDIDLRAEDDALIAAELDAAAAEQPDEDDDEEDDDEEEGDKPA